MVDIGFNNTKKFRKISISTAIFNELKALGKGSINTTIKHLLGQNKPQLTGQNTARLLELEEKIERLELLLNKNIVAGRLSK